jgi:hypothetical protein
VLGMVGYSVVVFFTHHLIQLTGWVFPKDI